MKSDFTSPLRLAEIAIIASILAAAALVPVQADATASHNFGELTWGNNNLWALIAPPSPLPMPSSLRAVDPFYELAPQVPSAGFPASPQSSACEHLGIVPGSNTTPCSHDHVIPVPPDNIGAFNANWHVFLVLCASAKCTPELVSGTLFSGQSVTLNLAQSVTLPGSTTPTPLTSVSLIQAAIASGAVTALDTHVVFICAIAPVVP